MTSKKSNINYKFYIISIIIIIMVLLFIFYNMVLNPPKKIYSGIAFYGDFVNESSLDALKNKLTKDIVNDANYEIKFDCFYKNSEDDIIKSQKFSSMILDNEIDIIISDKDYFHYLTYTGYLVNLEEITTDEQLNEFKAYEELYYDSTQYDSTQRIYGIKLNNSTLLKTINYPIEQRYIGIVRNCTRNNNTLKTLNYLIN